MIKLLIYIFTTRVILSRLIFREINKRIQNCVSITLVVRISAKCPQFKNDNGLQRCMFVVFMNGCTLLLISSSITSCFLYDLDI